MASRKISRGQRVRMADTPIAVVGKVKIPSPKRATESYLALAAMFPIQPIRADDELDAAIQMVDGLLGRARPLDEQEQGYLESLSYEIERYESAAYPMPEVSGVALLRHLMEAKEVNLSEVAAATGIALSTLSGVLHEKRSLNRTHMEKLGPYFGVHPGVFMD